MPDEHEMMGEEHAETARGGEPSADEKRTEDLELAAAVAETVAKVAETTHEVIEAAEHGHAGAGTAHAVHGAAGATGTMVEATVGESHEAERLAEDAAAVLELVGAAAETYIAAEKSIREVLPSSGHGASGSASVPHGNGVHEARDAHAASEHDQREIVLDIETEADPDRLLRVASIELEEKLGDVYLARVHVVSEIRWSELPMVASTDLLGADVTVSIMRGGAVRAIRGIVRHVEEEGTSSTHLTMRLEVVPAMALLAQQIDSRVFWELSVLDVIDAVLGAGLAPYDRELKIAGMTEREPREYCVQYQESDLAFVHRLLEEEGLTYYFDHTDEREKVIIVETNEQLPGLSGDHVDFLRITDGAHGHAEQDAITEMKECRRVVSTGVALSDHDWRQSRTKPIAVSPDDPPDDRGRARLVYDHGRGLDLGRQPGGHDGQRQVRLRKELIGRDAIVATGRGTAIGLAAGLAFTTLDDRELAPMQDRSWVVTGVRHRASDPRVHAIVGGGNGEARYENHFECIPVEVPYRPTRRTRKPRIFGMQTGVVVGPQGQPIFSDQHRRVRVRFHWDRYRPNDTHETQDLDRHTCWVRVSQSWAGSGFGTLFLPRVGMEVVVSFLDGDPDRPIVVGCVYNGENPPPYHGDDEWTVSTVKTRSVDGVELCSGSNELRFEDKKGAEQVFLHAERDLDEVVEHDHSTRVKRNQSNTVDVDQTELVGRDQTMTVRGERKVVVEKNEDITVTKSQYVKINEHHSEQVDLDQILVVSGKRDVFVGMKDTETFDGGRETTVNYFDNTTVNANKNVHVTGQHNIKADEHFHVEQGAQMVHLGNSRVHLESDGTITLTRPDASVTLAAAGIQITTGGTLILRGGGCELIMRDKRVTITAVAEATMRAGAGVVKVAPQYAEMAAPNVSVEAEQIASVQAGTLVRIN